MNMNLKEQSVYFYCQNKISFVSSFFSQSSPSIELDDNEKRGLFLVLVGVLRDLEAIENGFYNEPSMG